MIMTAGVKIITKEKKNPEDPVFGNSMNFPFIIKVRKKHAFISDLLIFYLSSR